MRRLFTFLVIIAAFFAGGYIFTNRANHDVTTTTVVTTSTTSPVTIPTTATTSTTASAGACQGDLLNITLTPTGGGLGTATFQLVFQNSGAAACTLRGTPSLQLRSSGGNLPTTEIPATSGFGDAAANRPAALVTVPIGGRALVDASYPTVPAGSERTCAIASSIAVTVPGSIPVVIATSLSPCANGLLRVSPFFA
jgi:hypothetical protein